MVRRDALIDATVDGTALDVLKEILERDRWTVCFVVGDGQYAIERWTQHTVHVCCGTERECV
jgi:hypothetical protein